MKCGVLEEVRCVVLPPTAIAQTGAALRSAQHQIPLSLKALDGKRASIWAGILNAGS